MPPSQATDPTAPQRSILVVDDNAVNTLIASAMIKSLGHTATAVHDGESAVKAVIRERWSLVLMDLSMPGMDGLTATERIRSWEQHSGLGQRVPIIALTAHTSPNIRSVCMGCGMDYYLAKPLLETDLIQVITVFGEGRARTGEFAVGCLVDVATLRTLAGLPPGIAQDLARRFARDARIGLANLGDALAGVPDLDVMDSGIFLRGALAQVGAAQALEALDRILGLVAIGHEQKGRDLLEPLGLLIEDTIARVSSQIGATAG